ncbi:uncharacterized protein JN550_001766 [Neoarthrinium moseri]|uniref:uncharacterized protein n=1 Tax=Neoarthrinium moseri TaxID=1658444 RepID=UPI001FDBF5D7|nr:uncharacterized protein JN550_001766 [Neoarthrinium moseri]KAI1876270.1 hypothetical protein JN550_001766 [Neoarthrinium moseri]
MPQGTKRVHSPAPYERIVRAKTSDEEIEGMGNARNIAILPVEEIKSELKGDVNVQAPSANQSTRAACSYCKELSTENEELKYENAKLISRLQGLTVSEELVVKAEQPDRSPDGDPDEEADAEVKRLAAQNGGLTQTVVSLRLALNRQVTEHKAREDLNCRIYEQWLEVRSTSMQTKLNEQLAAKTQEMEQRGQEREIALAEKEGQLEALSEKHQAEVLKNQRYRDRLRDAEWHNRLLREDYKALGRAHRRNADRLMAPASDTLTRMDEEMEELHRELQHLLSPYDRRDRGGRR